MTASPTLAAFALILAHLVFLSILRVTPHRCHFKRLNRTVRAYSRPSYLSSYIVNQKRLQLSPESVFSFLRLCASSAVIGPTSDQHHRRHCTPYPYIIYYTILSDAPVAYDFLDTPRDTATAHPLHCLSKNNQASGIP